MGSVVVFIFFVAVALLLPGVPGYVIAQRRGLSNPWIAFVPFVGLWIVVCESIDEKGWIGVLAIVPIVALALVIALAFKVPRAHRRSRWWTVALIVPGVNFAGYWAYAFTLPRAPELQLADALG